MFPLNLKNKCSLFDDSKISKCTRNRQSGITCLLHNISFDNIIQLLASGYIKTGKELQEEK